MRSLPLSAEVEAAPLVAADLPSAVSVERRNPAHPLVGLTVPAFPDVAPLDPFDIGVQGLTTERIATHEDPPPAGPHRETARRAISTDPDELLDAARWLTHDDEAARRCDLSRFLADRAALLKEVAS